MFPSRRRGRVGVRKYSFHSADHIKKQKAYSNLALNLLKQIETKQSTNIYIWANLLNHRKWSSSKRIKLTKGQPPQAVEGELGSKSINIHTRTHMCVYINLTGEGILGQRGGQQPFGAFRSIVIVFVASI